MTLPLRARRYGMRRSSRVRFRTAQSTVTTRLAWSFGAGPGRTALRPCGVRRERGLCTQGLATQVARSAALSRGLLRRPCWEDGSFCQTFSVRYRTIRERHRDFGFPGRLALAWRGLFTTGARMDSSQLIEAEPEVISVVKDALPTLPLSLILDATPVTWGLSPDQARWQRRLLAGWSPRSRQMASHLDVLISLLGRQRALWP
jgi:hypothetical protein